MLKLSDISLKTHLVVAFACCFAGLLGANAPLRAQSSQDPVYVFHTNLGDINVQLFPDVAPKTVANFLTYVNSGAYNGTIFHRSVPGFVIQSGGYNYKNNTLNTIPTNAPVVNEFHLSNVRGTIAMAKLGSDPNSATDQWFFNESDSNAANLDSQNGGFTVFGKIVDSAGLAVMDRIAAVPTYNFGGGDPNSLLAQLPVIDYQQGQPVAADQLVTVSSITAASNWSATSISAAADGSNRLLWSQPNGAASFWTINSTGSIKYSATFGPYAGWRATKIVAMANGGTDIFWTGLSGIASYWQVSANGAITYSPTYGPYSGWYPADFDAASDGTVRLLWINSNGSASYWNIGANGAIKFSPTYGPNSGWTANSISAASGGVTRILWTGINSEASYWTIPATGKIAYSPIYGPYTGWRCAAIGVGSDGSARLQWNNGDSTSFWTINGSGGIAYSPVWGPFAGWSPEGFAVAPDNSVRLLWGQSNGAASFWTVGANGKISYSPTFGPY